MLLLMWNFVVIVVGFRMVGIGLLVDVFVLVFVLVMFVLSVLVVLVCRNV